MRERPQSGPGLAVAQCPRAPGKVELGPAQTQGLTGAPAGQGEEPGYRHGRRPNSCVRLLKCGSKRLVFVVAQTPIPAAISGTHDPVRRIVRAHFMADRIAEDGAEQGDGAAPGAASPPRTTTAGGLGRLGPAGGLALG